MRFSFKYQENIGKEGALKSRVPLRILAEKRSYYLLERFYQIMKGLKKEKAHRSILRLRLTHLP